jgi:adenine deaminase
MKTKDTFSVKGVIVNPTSRTKEGGEILISNGEIKSIIKNPKIKNPFILPGFIDSHVHIESSMLIPSQFARMAVKHGTIAVVTDPHEVANVAGIEGIWFMLSDARKTPMHFFFGVPSCVPASPLEKSGATLNSTDVKSLLSEDDFLYLAEMMNFPGVINDDEEVVRKISAAKELGKPIDGHAPGLSGEDLIKYVASGIETDHECSTTEEAIQKIKLGMKVLIREGSAAKNFDTLISLVKEFPKSVMFCTDDCHPDYLEKGHINKLVAKAIKQGYDFFDVIYAATINPINHYKLPLGRLKENDPADFILVKDLDNFEVLATYIKGKPVYSNNKINFSVKNVVRPKFSFRSSFRAEDLNVFCSGQKLNVIGAIEGELLTKWTKEDSPVPIGENVYANPKDDFLKIVLLDRYSEDPPVVCYIRGFGLKTGAIAASIAHDSHHIICIGCEDESIEQAFEWIISQKGGICFAKKQKVKGIPLPFFGLMTNLEGTSISKKYHNLNKLVRDAGSNLNSPFMTLSFMALTVIPELKVFHNGLFDANNFKKVPLFF